MVVWIELDDAWHYVHGWNWSHEINYSHLIGFIYKQILTTWMKLNLVVKLTHTDENEWKDNIDHMNLLKGMVPHGWKWPWKWWILMKFHNMNEISSM